MRCKVYYMSQRGAAEAVAEAVAGAAGVKPEPLLPAYMPENVDLMFLGCEGARADRVTLQFIESLGPSRVKCAALFQCARTRGEALAQMRAALEARGIAVLTKTCHTPVRSLFGLRPEPPDLDAARDFARESIAAAEAKR
jgi:hypothetical protein